MAASPNVCLTLSNQPDNVVLVRAALSGLAQTIGVDGVELNDIRTAVTEACNNVVLHAYEGAEGPLQLEVFVADGALEIVVRDHGTGIRPHIRSEEAAALGIGLSIIQALAPRVEFRDVAGGGTEVRMEFFTAPSTLCSLTGVRYDPPKVTSGQLASTTGLALAPGELARKVLPRVICVLAARARFTTDRIGDAELLADALIDGAGRPEEATYTRMSVRVEPRELQLRVGPLASGRAAELIATASVSDAGPVIERLTDEHELLAGGDGELLTLRMRDNR